jgi:hypothetical protein
LDKAMGRTKVPPAKADSKREKWLRWLEIIDKDVTTLVVNRMAWRGITRATRDRTPPLPPSFLFEYFGHTYAFTQGAGIRRQAEIAPDVATLALLLAEIANDPERISREFWVSRYPWGQQWRGDNEFTDLFDQKELGHLDGSIATSDLGQIRRTSAQITEWVNHHVAHLSVRPAPVIPTFDELDAAVDVVARILMRWDLCLTGRDTISLEPVPQYDWLAPLRLPWIVDP